MDTMNSASIVLNAYSSPFECLYRILRAGKVVYVVIEDPSVLPEDNRVYGPDVIRELSRWEEWFDEWETLTIDRDQTGELVTKKNAFAPHRLPERFIRNGFQQVNILGLPILKTVKYRTIYTSLDGSPCYAKYARFSHELQDIEREVGIYQYLMDHGCTLVPKLLGYVYEEQPLRTIGFLVEEISGRHAAVDDYSQCVEALRELHQFIIHGDINQYNIIISDTGPKFVDLESSTIPDTKNIAWDEQAENEMQLLRAALSEESGLGRPY